MRLLEVLSQMVWAMEPTVMNQMIGVIKRRALGEQVDAESIAAIVAARDAAHAGVSASQLSASDRGYALDSNSGIAVLPISGVIMKRASMVNGASQPRGTSVEKLRTAFRAAMADKAVSGIMLHVDSPGGSVDGLYDLAREIMAARGTKPIHAIGDGLMASAAYFLASSADKVHATTDTLLPSIGTMVAIADTSQAYESQGVKIHLITSGGIKGAGTDGVPVPQAYLDRWQSIVNQHTAEFKGHVQLARGMTTEQINVAADGGVVKGHAAVGMKIADEIMTVEEAMAGLASAIEAKTHTRAASVSLTGSNVSASDDSQGDGDMRFKRNGGALGVLVAAAAAATLAVEVASPIGAVGRKQDPLRDPDNPSSGGGGGGGAPVAEPKQDDPKPDALALERARNAAIYARAEAFKDTPGVDALVRGAVKDGTSAEAFSTQLLDLVAKSKTPQAAIDYAVNGSGWDAEKKVIENAMIGRMLITAGVSMESGKPERDARVARALGFDSPELARKAISEASRSNVNGSLHRASLRCLAMGRLGRGGVRVDENHESYVMGVVNHSTSDLPNLLQNVTNKVLQGKVAMTETTWQNVCAIGNAADFKSRKNVRTSYAPQLKKLVNGLKPEEKTMSDKSESLGLGTSAMRISFDRQTIINDDLGGIASTLSTIGMSCALAPEVEFINILTSNSSAGPTMNDGNTFFHSSRGNIGSSAALAYASWKAAVDIFLKTKDIAADVTYLQIFPKLLYVPTSQWATARELTSNNKYPVTGETNTNRDNIVKQRFPMTDIFSRYLENVSATRWYLFADPNDGMPAFIMSFLNGSQAPIVNNISDGSILGLTQEVVFDYQCDGANPEAAVTNAGT